MASTSGKSKVRFVGPAQQDLGSLEKQATYFLGHYWPNWNNYDQPQSYMIPPVFRYKNAEVSDRVFQRLRDCKIDEKSAVLKDRLADDAENIAYNSIMQLIQKGVQPPFICVHSLDIEKLQSKMDSLFPSDDENCRYSEKIEISKQCLREYDFVLLGPKVGLLVIEVKSSSFDREHHFKEGDRRLPNDYKHGLEQLNSFSALISFLQERSKVQWPTKIAAKKILLTSQLTRSRYKNWVASLSDSDQRRVQDKIGDVVQLFREDSDERALASVFEDIFQNYSSPISKEVYEAYAPYIASLASVTVIKSPEGFLISLNKMNFSENEATLAESLSIARQNPLANSSNPSKSAKLLSRDSLTKAPKNLKTIFKVVFVSSEQQIALNGPGRQLLFGPAGTGKTLVLQAKAIELLTKGESVTIFAPKCYMWSYKNLFDANGFDKYKVKSWSMEALMTCYQKFVGLTMSERDSSILPTAGGDADEKSHAFNIYEFIDKVISDRYSEVCAAFQWLLGVNDHVLIDDTIDDERTEILCPETMCLALAFAMAVAQRICPQKFVWMAIDPQKKYGKAFTNDDSEYYYNRVLMDIVCNDSKSENKIFHFVTTALRQVLRCPENVFKAAYDPKLPLIPDLSPLLAHKIQGIQTRCIRETRSNFEDAMEVLRQEVQSEIERLRERNFDLNDAALLISRNSDSFLVRDTLRRMCQKRWVDFKNEKIDMENISELDSETDLAVNENVLVVQDSCNVSSLEYSVVIHATCLPNNLTELDLNRVSYRKYRAMGRATAKIVDISVTYDEKGEV